MSYGFQDFANLFRVTTYIITFTEICRLIFPYVCPYRVLKLKHVIYHCFKSNIKSTL